MKNLRNFIVVLAIALFSFTSAGEESVYEGTNVNYNVSKANGIVKIQLGLLEPENYDGIIVMRSDSPSGLFRNVKEMTASDMSNLTSNNTIIDKYPLPGSVTAYYKVQTVDKSGVYRSYPCVKLSKH